MTAAPDHSPTMTGNPARLASSIMRLLRMTALEMPRGEVMSCAVSSR